MRKVGLKVKNSAYDILIGSEIFSKLGQNLAKLKVFPRLVVISDNAVSRLYGGAIKHSLRSSGFKSEMVLIPSGEKTKSIETAKKIYKILLGMKVHRDSTLIALGGGVIGDLAGFVASTYMRGVDLVQVPTTLLAQVDASIGGKTAVNLEEAKNIIGTFYQPRLVFSDTSCLITLPAKEIRNGLAEIIKYGVIKDPELFAYLEKQVLSLKTPKISDPKDFGSLLGVWENIIYRSALIKAKVVMEDEKETKGPRMILNFGHTIGHAIETILEYKGLSHGEAVSLGMIAAGMIAVRMKILNPAAAERIKKLISAVNLPAEIKNIDIDDIITKLILDKKVRDGKVVFVLPKRIGAVSIRNDAPIRYVREALKEIGAK